MSKFYWASNNIKKEKGFIMIKQVKKGLTLIELVVTIAVVAVLSGAAVGTYFGVTESNKHSRAESANTWRPSAHRLRKSS